jgi:hypothetical protein
MGNFDGISRSKNEFFDFDGDDYNKERSLFSVLINEYYNKYGVCLEYYITTYDTNYDRIFGEDNNRRYIRNFEFNGYFTLPKEDKVWSKFGIEGMDEIIAWVSKRHFDAASSHYIPQIGDIVKSDYSKYFYEITEVAEDTGQFFQSNQFIWEFHLRPMKNEFIDVDTSLSASDIFSATNLDDIFDITNDVDRENDDVSYNPLPNEKPNNDPFAH